MPLTPSYRGYVYLIGNSSHKWYKIGKSKRPKIRMCELGILLPFPIETFAVWPVIDPDKAEIQMHVRYQDQHLNGEWFWFNKKQLQCVIEAGPEGLVQVQLKREKRADTLHPFTDVMKHYLLLNNLEKTKENQDSARRAAQRALRDMFRLPVEAYCHLEDGYAIDRSIESDASPNGESIPYI